MGCYDLKWESHPSETLKFMSELRTRSIFVDLSLFCGNRVFSVHRVVVAAASGYLNRVLRLTNNSSHDSADPRARNVVIALPPTIRPDLLSLAVDFMYSGEISLESADLEEFMKVADALEIRGLRRTGGVPPGPPRKRPKLSGTPVPPLTPAQIPCPSPAGSSNEPIPEEKPEPAHMPALKSLKVEETRDSEQEDFDEVGPESEGEPEPTDAESGPPRSETDSNQNSNDPVFPGPSLQSPGAGPLVKVGTFLWRGTMVGTGIPFYSCDKCSYTTLHPEKGLRHDFVHLNAIALTSKTNE